GGFSLLLYRDPEAEAGGAGRRRRFDGGDPALGGGCGLRGGRYVRGPLSVGIPAARWRGRKAETDRQARPGRGSWRPDGRGGRWDAVRRFDAYRQGWERSQSDHPRSAAA